MNSFFKNSRVLVTGACGTVGGELVRQLLENYSVSELIALDNNESELFFLEQKFHQHKNTSYFLADVRDRMKLSRKMEGIDIVFHAAAYKHVILCERSPFEAVMTNILGVQNIVQAALDNNVGTVVFTSSDKAVNPTSVMGTSKLMGERLITAGNSNLRGHRTVLASTRFGNVMGSRGSVVPIFREQIRQGGPVTLTHPEMTRFIMSFEEAVRLVIDSSRLAKGGEVIVTKMPVIKIRDLAEVMIRELAPVYGHDPSDIEIAVIGSKPGEKLYEELMTHSEVNRSWELESYFVIRPAFTSLYRNIEYTYPGVISEQVKRPYNSSNVTPLNQKQLKEFLDKSNLLFRPRKGSDYQPSQIYWPDDENGKQESTDVDYLHVINN